MLLVIINQEKRKPAEIRDNDLLERLNETKNAYLKEVEILQSAMGGSSGGKISSPEEVKQFQNKLFKLKHFGGDLKEIFNKIENSKKEERIYRQGEVPVHSRSQRRRNHIERKKENTILKMVSLFYILHESLFKIMFLKKFILRV